MSEVCKEEQKDFWLRSAKAWQFYVEMPNRLPEIQPSKEQQMILEQKSDQLYIQGAAGNGKSVTLMLKMLKMMNEYKERKRFLFITRTPTLKEDIYQRLSLCPEFTLLIEKHDFELCTFYEMAANLLRIIGYQIVVPPNTFSLDIKKVPDTRLYRIQMLRERFIQSEWYRGLSAEQELDHTHTPLFLLEEFLWMKANGLLRKDDYLEVERVGREKCTHLTRSQRLTIYHLFTLYQQEMHTQYQREIDLEDYALLLLYYLKQIPQSLHYDFVLVDDVHELQPMQIKALVQLSKEMLVLAGDSRQPINQMSPHSDASLGLQLNGDKTRVLHQNFRSTRPILAFANALRLEDREYERQPKLTSLRNGELPNIGYFPSIKEFVQKIVSQIHWIQMRDPDASICLIDRYEEQDQMNHIPLLRALEQELDVINIKDYMKKSMTNEEKKPILLADIHHVKGLEFDYVFILQFTQSTYPLLKKIEVLQQKAGKDDEYYQSDLKRLIVEEKNLLYMAITRARKRVFLYYVDESPLRISPFVHEFHIDDFTAIGFDKEKMI
ncbi:3'-5' exonuclease [Thermoflavimicrobium daqui]|uniref:3'-5' exonuclease n=1 Tax=Thermoflavimicrobium daqui TaxID=2137476 RepID=UPI00143CFA7A|nr:3'-5' exonuclease [Thermoflavimicrobium daqui]